MRKRVGILSGVVFLWVLLLAGGALAEQQPAQTYKTLPYVRLNRSVLTISPLTQGARLQVVNWAEGYEPIQWLSLQPNVAEIDEVTGVITPKATWNGIAVLVARGTVSGRYAKAALVVRGYALRSFRLSANNLRIHPGLSYRFGVGYSPANATYRGITWRMEQLVSPEGEGTRSTLDTATGTFTAGDRVGESVRVFATASNGRTLYCNIIVQPVNVAAVLLTRRSGVLPVNATYDLSRYLAVLPVTAGDRTVRWSSSNSAIATVDESGLVTVLGAGLVRITATSNMVASKRADFIIRCTAFPVKSVALSAANITLDPNQAETGVVAHVLPSYATYKTVTWSSSDESVAKVDPDSGKITAIKPGKAYIFAVAGRAPQVKAGVLTVRVRGEGFMRTVSLSAVGDVVLGGDPIKELYIGRTPIDAVDNLSSFQRFYKNLLAPERGNGDTGYFLGDVTKELAGTDISVFNMEGTLTNRSAHEPTRYSFKANPKEGVILRDAGFDVACLANNHAQDYLAAGYTDTVRALGAFNIRAYGNGSGRSSVFRTSQGVNVGFLGYSIPANRSDIAAGIRALKKKGCAIVVVSFHWERGIQGSARITAEEVSYSRYAVNAGATLVLGHHKHVLSGMEEYKGRMIAYDIGNFLACVVPYAEYRRTMIYQQEFNVFNDGYVETAQVAVVPCLNSDNLAADTPNDGHVHLAKGDEYERILNAIKSQTPAALWSKVRTSALTD